MATACAGDDDGPDDSASATSSGPETTATASGGDGLDVVAGAPFPSERCDANRAAGPLTFLTSFDLAAAASIVDVLVADERGYFADLCLDVTVVGSFSTDNYPLVAAGEAQFSSGGSFAEVASFADPDDPEFAVLVVEGRTPIDALIVRADAAESISDLAGTTIGVQGRTPTSVLAMLAAAGLEDGVDVTSVPLPGFDPLANFELDGLVGITGYRSNEVGRLEAAGVPIRVFTPDEEDVPGSFGVVYTSAAFAAANPTVVADVTRAVLRGLADALADPEAAAELAIARAEAAGNAFFFSLDGETFRWSTEAELIRSSTPTGAAIGVPDLEGLRAELEVADRFGVFGTRGAPAAETLVAPVAATLVDADGAVVWPG